MSVDPHPATDWKDRNPLGHLTHLTDTIQSDTPQHQSRQLHSVGITLMLSLVLTQIVEQRDNGPEESINIGARRQSFITQNLIAEMHSVRQVLHLDSDERQRQCNATGKLDNCVPLVWRDAFHRLPENVQPLQVRCVETGRDASATYLRQCPANGLHMRYVVIPPDSCKQTRDFRQATEPYFRIRHRWNHG